MTHVTALSPRNTTFFKDAYASLHGHGRINWNGGHPKSNFASKSFFEDWIKEAGLVKEWNQQYKHAQTKSNMQLLVLQWGANIITHNPLQRNISKNIKQLAKQLNKELQAGQQIISPLVQELMVQKYSIEVLAKQLTGYTMMQYSLEDGKPTGCITCGQRIKTS